MTVNSSGAPVVDLAALDLNLLVVFEAVLASGSVTGAARRLHVTQSAVSNSLARLRATVRDPLLVRSGRGLVPTPRAQELGLQIVSALDAVRAALGGVHFDPVTSTRRFTLACGDDAGMAWLPRIAALFAERLPAASLRVVSLDHALATSGLATGEVDALLGALPVMPPDTLSDPVFIEDGVCVTWKGNPAARRRLTLAGLLALGHVRVALGAADALDPVDAALARQSRARHIALSVPHYSLAALCLVATPLVAIFPRSAARALARLLPLRILEPPLLLPAATAYQVWHLRTDHDAGARAFREIVRDAAGKPAAPRRPAAA